MEDKTKFYKAKLRSFPSDRNILTPIELKDYTNFDVMRVYYVTDHKGPTGAHMHYVENELFVMIKGSCTATIDYGQGLEEIPFGAGEILNVPHDIWHGYKDFSDDAVMMALSSTNYNPDRSDYLEDYDQYIKIRDEHMNMESNA